jgi:uncharacterized protein
MRKYRLLYASYLEKYKDVIEFTRSQLMETSRFQKHDYHPWSLPEHRMNHTLLVLRNSLLLTRNRKVDKDVVALAAILHDVAFYSSERKEHANEGAKIAEKYLQEHEYPNDLVQKVVHAIKVHTGPLASSSRSTEAKILQDADTIDKIGSLAIATFLLHYGSKRMMPKQALEELKKDTPKILRWYYRTMNFPEGKKIVGEGCKYIRTFIRKLQNEI